MDAFHVRNTYAQLDISGVKGDGYEDGVERTRARIGTSRASQINALAAIGDGNEKKGDLDERELIALASVDRYGFFSTPSHDRLVLLPSTPLTKRLVPSPSPGPRDASTSGTTLSSLPPPQPPLKETSRIGKWTRMLRPRKREVGGNVESWDVKPRKESKLRERIYKGVPDRWRPAAWELLMSRNAVEDMCSGEHGHGAMVTFSLQQLERDYNDCLDKPSTYDIQIDLDVPRTISGHVLFRTRYGAGQRSLFHVLHCFSLRCPTCGYVQGMGPIAATLLCYFPPSHVYASLVRLHSSPEYALHTIFAPGFPGLLEAIFVQERIIRETMPAVYKAFGDMGVSTTSYATKWYITLFANSVTFQTQLRLWDAFLLEGKDVFVVLAVGVVWVFRDQITSASANFETVLSLLSSFFVPEDENILLFWVERTMADNKLRANMTRWRAEWQEIVKEGKEATALL
ncbi:RabGAP/TBC [Marasmius fiardii PR-910]|nr:RabGAP/TBC [Marasmius fiardii PR-910]